MKQYTTPVGENLEEHPQGLRPVYTTTHQGSGSGYFHKWIEKLTGKANKNTLYAILEGKDGKVYLLNMDYNSIQFLDLKPLKA